MEMSCLVKKEKELGSANELIYAAYKLTPKLIESAE